MSENQESRRAVDPLIVEMHGMLKTVVQKLDDHIEVDEQAHQRLEKVDERLRPVEDLLRTAKSIAKPLALIGTPIFLGIGAAVWAWFKGVLTTRAIP